MSSSYDYMMQSLQRARDEVSAAKQQDVAAKAEEKRRLLDPNFEIFNPDLYDVLDADTLRHRRTGEEVRVRSRPGFSVDSFETNPSYYVANPKRLEHHRRTFAKLYGWKPEDVKIQDLTNLGKIQKRRLQQNIEQLRGVGFQRQGVGAYNRTLAQFEDESVFQHAKDTTGNASYFAPSNILGRARDLNTGELQKLERPRNRNILQTLVTDPAVNFSVGALRAANTMVQGLTAALPGKAPDAFFEKNKERLETIKDVLNSEEQLFRERMDSKHSALNPELFQMRYERNLQRRMPENHARIKAAYSEYKDRLRYLKDNPGRAFDALFESLPYMIGVGVVGRLATSAALRNVGKKALENATKKGLKGEARQAYANKQIKRFINSKGGQAAINRTAEKTGVTTVGITEGLTTAGEAYSSIIGMTEKEAQESETYRALRAEGKSHEDALNEMAESTLYKTLFSVAGLAAVASRYTGAGAFEAGLLRAGAVKPVEQAVTKQAAKGGVIRKTARKAGELGVKYTKFAGPAGAREFAEETIQSGGGELISQIFSTEATGEAVGPGVGAATAEGGVVGFLSGIGAQTVTGGAKKLVQAYKRGSESGYDKYIGGDGIRISDGKATAGGGIAAVHIASKKKGYDPVSTFENLFVETAANFKQEKEVNLEQFNALEYHFSNAVESGKFSVKDLANYRDAMEQLTQGYTNKLTKEVEAVLEKDKQGKPLTGYENSVLGEAQRRELSIVDKKNVKDASEHVKKYLKHSDRINTLIKQAEEASANTIPEIAEITGDKTAELRRVANEKLGDGIGSKGLGLEGYRRQMSDAIATGDSKVFDNLRVRFANFLKSQRNKVTDLNKLIGNAEELVAQNQDPGGIKVGNYTYQAGKTERLREILSDELQVMEDVRNELLDQYFDANPKDTRQELPEEAVPEAPEIVPETTEEPEPQEATTEEEEAAPEAPETTPEEVEEAAFIYDSATEETVETGTAKEPQGDSRTVLEFPDGSQFSENEVEAIEVDQEVTELLDDQGDIEAETDLDDLDWGDIRPKAGEVLLFTDPTEESRYVRVDYWRVDEDGAHVFRVELLENPREIDTQQGNLDFDATGETPHQERTRKKGAIEKAISHLPEAIRNVIKIVYQKYPKIPKGAFKSLKSNLKEAGITNPNALRWAFKNKDLPALKEVKSPKDLTDLVIKQLVYKSNNDNYPKMEKGVLTANHRQWVMTLLQHFKQDIYFMEMMMDVPLKDVTDPKRERPGVPPPNLTALNETYAFYLANTGFQGIAKHYRKLVTKYATESAEENEPSASGDGYWIVIPRIPEPKQPKVNQNISEEDISRLTEHVYNNRLVLNLRGLTDIDVPASIEYDPEVIRAIEEYKRSQKETIENFVRRVVKRIQEGRDLIPSDTRLNTNVIQEFIINDPVFAVNEKELEAYKKQVEERKVAIKKLCTLSPSTWCTATWAAPDKVSDVHNHLLIVNGKTVVGLELTDDGVLTDSTRVANDGVSSIDHLPDTLAYLEKHKYDYEDNKAIKKAIKAKAAGEFDIDSTREVDIHDHYAPEDWYDPDLVERDVLAEQAQAHNDWLLQQEHQLEVLSNILTSDLFKRIKEGTYTEEDIPSILAWDHLDYGLNGINLWDLVLLSDEELLSAINRTQAAMNEPFGNGLIGPTIGELIDETLRQQVSNEFTTPFSARWHAYELGGLGFNRTGIVLNNLLHSDTGYDANSDEQFEAKARKLLSPLVYEKIENGTITLTDYGYYALVTATNASNELRTYHRASSELLSRRYQARADVTSVSVNGDTVERFTEPRPLNKEILEREALIQEYFDINVPIHVSNAGRFINYMHQHIQYLKDNWYQLNRRAAADIREDLAQNIFEDEEIPFAKQQSGGIEGWADSETATLNAAYLSPRDAGAVALHEVAHLGMIRVANEIGGFDELYKILNGAKTQLLEKAPELLERTGYATLQDLANDYGFDLSTPEGQGKLLVELAARWAEQFNNEEPASWWLEFIEAISNWIKQFVGKDLSKKEVDSLISGFIKYGTNPQFTEATPAKAEAQPEPERTQPAPLRDTNLTRLNNARRNLAALEAGTITEDGVVLTGKRGKDQEAYLRLYSATDGGVEGAKLALQQIINFLEGEVTTEDTTPEAESQETLKLTQTAAKIRDGQSVPALPEASAETPLDDPSRWQRFRKWLRLDKVVGGLRNIMPSRIRERLHQHDLPPSLKDAYRRANKQSRSLLGSIVDVAEKLQDPNVRDKFFNAATLTPEEEETIMTFLDFRQEFVRHFQRVQRPIDQVKNEQEIPFLGERISQDPIYYVIDGVGEVDSNTATAMALEGFTWLATSGPNTVINDRQAINAILGRDSNFVPFNEEFEKLTLAGTLRSNVVNSTGQGIWRHMNLISENNPQYDSLLTDKMIGAMGTATVSTLKHMGRIEVTNIDYAWFKDRMNTDTLDETDLGESEPSAETPIQFIRSAPAGTTGQAQYNNLPQNELLIGAWSKGRKALSSLFAARDIVREPLLQTPGKEHIPQKIKRSMSNVSRKMKKAIAYTQARPWEAVDTVAHALKRFDPEQFLAMGHKYHRNMDTVHNRDRLRVEARNRTLLKTLNDGLQWFDDHGQRGFYFTYSMNKSGRIQIESNVINPQNSKVQRYMFGMKEWNRTYNSRPADKDQQDALDMFLVSVAQGLGIHIDKLLITAKDAQGNEINSILGELNKITSEQTFQDAVALLAEDSDRVFEEKELEILEPYISKEGVHSLAAMLAWNEYQQADGEFTVSLPIDVDGINNGLSAGALQTPSSNPGNMELVKDILRATGILFNGDAHNYAAWLAEGNQDNYQATGARAADNIDLMAQGFFQRPEKIKYLKALGVDTDNDPGLKRDALVQRNAHYISSASFLHTVEELRNKEGRKWAKIPLMIVAYGASILAIIRTVSNTAINDFYEKLASTNELTDVAQQEQAVLNILNDAYKLVHTVNDANLAMEHELEKSLPKDSLEPWTLSRLRAAYTAPKYKTLPEFARGFAMTPVQENLFRDAVEITYGEALAEALETRLAPFRAIRARLNEASQLMVLIFAEDFASRIAAMEAVQGHVLDNRERNNILRKMHSEGLVPSIATAFSETVDENLEIANYGRTTLGENAKARTYFRYDSQGQGFQFTDRVYKGVEGTIGTPQRQASLVQAITGVIPKRRAGVGGLIKGIHGADGTNNSSIWGSFPILNMHDAGLGPADIALEATRTVNKDFYDTHRNYSIPTEFLKSLTRMLPLLNENDSRLAAARKQNVFEGMKAHLLEFGAINKKHPYFYQPERLVREQVEKIQNAVTDANRARDILFGPEGIAYVSQFALDTGEYVVNPQDKEIPASVNDMAQDFLDDLTRQYIQDRRKTVTNLVANLGDVGNFNEALQKYIQDKHPMADQVMDVLQAVFRKANHPGGELLSQYYNLLEPLLKENTEQHQSAVPVVVQENLVDEQGEKVSALYDMGTRKIYIDPVSDVNIGFDLVHEIFHAGTHNKLQEMAKNKDPKFALLEQTAREQAKEWIKSTDPVIKETGERIWFERSEPVLMVGEYMAYQMTQSKSSNHYDPLFADSDNINRMLQELGSILRNASTGEIYYRATEDRVNHDIFEKIGRTELQADKLRQLFDYLTEQNMGPTDPEHQQMLTRLIDTFLEPGIRSIEPLFYKLGIDPDTIRNAGDLQHAMRVIRVQSSGNQLSNSEDMSMQEIMAHEISHAILESAVEGNHAINKEARRLYEQARTVVTSDMFIPEDAAGDPDILREVAQQRWDHIFDNPDGHNYHEFLAIALTNKQFATILSRISDRDTRQPIWSEGILHGITRLFHRAIDWITGQATKRGPGSIHASLVGLSDTIIEINNRNLARIQERSAESLWRNKIDNTVVNNINALLDKLQAKARSNEEEARKVGGKAFLQQATHVALVSRNEEARKTYREFMRFIGVTKNNAISEAITEILPYNKDNIGTNDGKPGWIDLLRKSKVMVDTARQRLFEHSRSTLIKSFDKKNHLTKADREAMNNVVLKTDLYSLLDTRDTATVTDLVRAVNSQEWVRRELEQAKLEMKNLLLSENQLKLNNMFLNQANSLSHYMVNGVMLLKNPMMNANNIVRQYNLDKKYQTSVANFDELVKLVDRITTLMALLKTNSNDLLKVSRIINHEMERGIADNGFITLVGMHGDFRSLAREELFDGNPVQMIKGYTYEMMDTDINIEFIRDIPSEHQRMKREGMTMIGPVRKDIYDINTPRTVMYKGIHGLSKYQKSVVSLTDQQHRGSNLFATAQRDSQLALQNLGDIRYKSSRQALQQYKAGWSDEGNHMVPILNDAGEIVDYRYLMSESTKKKHMGKKDMFDQILPRMFGTLVDRTKTKEINTQVVELLKEEYEAYGDNHPIHKFIRISPDSKNKKARDMYNLLPKDMQLQLEQAFNGKIIPVRDDVVNLAFGFRKLSATDIPGLGKAAWQIRVAEKIWLEVVQWMRLKVAILTPEVVIGNLASNFAILVTEGIPENYIRRMSGEAISGMRSYQKDIRARDELHQKIGAARAVGRDTTKMRRLRAKLDADIAMNPVGELVREGLFTSIVEDLGSDEDTYRERLIGGFVDKTQKFIPKAAVTLVKEAYMLPGTRGFRAALAATQYGDFVGRYVKFKYDTEVRKVDRIEAIHEALATFIYYDMPQNRWLQLANDYGFVMFTKFFLRIQPVIARIWSQNPTKAMGVFAVSSALKPAPIGENIAQYALFQGATRKFEPIPLLHLDKIQPLHPSLFQWLSLFSD